MYIRETSLVQVIVFCFTNQFCACSFVCSYFFWFGMRVNRESFDFFHGQIDN